MEKPKAIEGLLGELGKMAGYKLTRSEAEAQGKCVRCGKSYEGRVFTEAGWRETKISKMCEVCWEEIFSEEDDG